jgi:hypothetical protein
MNFGSMLRAIVIGSTSAVFFGMTGAICGTLFYGVASVPFIASASLGFALGTFRWYYASLRQALIAMDAYPALLRLHLDANYPQKQFRTWGLGAFRSERFKKSLILEQMLVVAWLTAQPALEEVRSNEEKILVEEAAGASGTENGEKE